MIVVEYEFIKNSKGVTNQCRIHYKGVVNRSILRSEFADKPSCPVIGEIVEGIDIGWAVDMDFAKETATIFGPFKLNPISKKYERVDKKEGMSWLIAIKKKGGVTYGQ